MMVTETQLWDALNQVKDPEIPVVSLVEMGIIRNVTIAGDNSVTVIITPTFAGCPALQVMKTDIVDALKAIGVQKVTVETVNSPAWTTNWITEEARAKLKAFGLAPPPVHGGNFVMTLMDAVECPYCGSERTSLRNSFGSTPCRMIYYCNNCQQPFEQFKPL